MQEIFIYRIIPVQRATSASPTNRAFLAPVAALEVAEEGGAAVLSASSVACSAVVCRSSAHMEMVCEACGAFRRRPLGAAIAAGEAVAAAALAAVGVLASVGATAVAAAWVEQAVYPA